MKFPRLSGAICLLLAISISSEAGPPQAATPKPQVFTIQQAITYSIAHYPSVRAALERIRAAHGATSLARTSYLPSGDVLWQSNRATDNNITGLLLPQGIIPPISGTVRQNTADSSAWGSAGGLFFSWEPFDFGYRGATVDAARAGEAIAAAQSDLTRLGVATATARAFFALLSAEQTVKVAQANENRWQVFDNSVHVLASNQLRPGADASRADAELARARTQLIRARTAVNAARTAFADILGITGTKVEVSPGPLLGAPPSEDVARAPLTSHPAVVAQRDQIQQAQWVEQALARSYVPRFFLQSSISGRGSGIAPDGGFTGGTTGLGPDHLNWAAGVTVTFPIVNYFSIRDQKEIAQANQRYQQDVRGETMQDLSSQIEQARSVLDGARQVAQNTPVELASAQQSELQARARYQAGLGTIVDVTDAESLLVQAQIDDTLARLNVWQSLAGVAAAQGNLEPFLDLVK